MKGYPIMDLAATVIRCKGRVEVVTKPACGKGRRIP